MPDPITGGIALVGSTVVSGVLQNEAAEDAAAAGTAAAELQTQSADRGLAEVARQFDEVKALLGPYAKAGERGLAGMEALLGLGGADAQASAIEGIMRGPEFATLARQGEEAILANASATGGLRGGNVQAALAQFRPNLLSDLINQRFQRLGAVTQLGQAAAAGQASAGIQTGQSTADLYGQIGAAQAGGALAGGAANAGFKSGFGGQLGQTGSMLGTLAMLGKLKF